MIITLVIGVLVAIKFVSIADKNPEFDFMLGAFWAILCGFLVMSAFFIGQTIPDNEYDMTLRNTIYIEALRDNRDVEGRCYLGRGRIRTEQYYYYLINTDKGYETKKINADNSYIVHSNEPRIETYTSKDFKNKSAWIYAIPHNEYNIIYVPEGSILSDYEIDLQ